MLKLRFKGNQYNTQKAIINQSIISINALGTYADAIVNRPSITMATRCCPRYLATLPTTPLNIPSIILTFCPTVNCLISDNSRIMSSA